MPEALPSLAEVAALVDRAATHLEGVAAVTPLQRNDRLSDLTGADVWLKREDLQPVRSYKLRGAYTLMSQLDDGALPAGVVCASAGNHAQGVAWACARLGIDGAIFVPTTTPRQKRDRIRALGGDRVRLIVTGETYDAADQAAHEAADKTGATLVPAFDDLRTVAGQGTVAAEIVAQLGAAPDVLLAPVGGGGLLAGCGAWLHEAAPTTRVIGVEPAGAACIAAGLQAGHPVRLATIDTFVDGAAVRRAGEVTLPLVRALGCRLVAIPEGQVCSEMLSLYQVDGVIAEPAGALASSALRQGPHDLTVRVAPGQTVVAIVSGGNNDISRYSEVLERSLLHEGRKHYFMVTFPQEPGALRRFLDGILGPDDDIVLFEYTKKSNRETGPALVGVELGDPDELPALLDRIAASPIQVEAIPPDGSFYRYLV
ncbi:MAG: threonine ammonia-lyase IlvA [Actinomycetia bacterium]|nr:threonine ammonia-lyase IlvA [Actinomycetes bacterium]